MTKELYSNKVEPEDAIDWRDFNKKPMAGWVFIVKIATDKPDTKTFDLLNSLHDKIKEIPEVHTVRIEEDYTQTPFSKNVYKCNVCKAIVVSPNEKTFCDCGESLKRIGRTI